MTSASFKKPLTPIVGATLILLGTTATPSLATTLVGFSTYGDMMRGTRVTASFLDGTAQSLSWGATEPGGGGVFGSGWSLTQAGNSFDSPWYLNSSQSITSLVIDGVPGNTVFDIYPYGDGLPHTTGSADGWGFQALSGLGPNVYDYTDPIDISQGDLFGTLSLYWGNGFAGALQFRADTDSGSSNDPVQPRDPVVRITPPTASAYPVAIYEGQSAATTVYATDAGEDAITFFLNGGNLGTDFSRSGTRSASTNLGFYPDNGEWTYTAQVRDEDGNYSAPVTSTLSVFNVAPTLTTFDLSSSVITEGQAVSAWLAATDPGADWQTFFVNGNPVGIDGLTAGTRSIAANLGTLIDDGEYFFTGLAQDKDSAFSNPLTRSLTVLNIAPTLTQLTQNLTVAPNELFNFSAAAVDPGISDLLTFDWDFNLDGLYDDFTGLNGQWSFADEGNHPIVVRVSDGDGGYTYGSFLVAAVKAQPVVVPSAEPIASKPDEPPDGPIASEPDEPPAEPIVDKPTDPQTVPEPGTVLSLFAFSLLATTTGLKRKA